MATYLISGAGWSEASIGMMLLTLNLSTVVAQTPAGWLIDHTRYKRYLTAVAALTIGVCMLVPPIAPQVPVVLLACALIGAAAAVIPPAIAAITLGIVGPNGLTKQTGSNQAFNHAGNVVAALSIGLVAAFLLPWAVFPIVALLAISAGVMVLTIPERTIDHEVARGGEENRAREQAADGKTAPRFSSLRVIFGNRPLVVFMICVGLFHFANAAMLPLAGQELAKADQKYATLYMSACVVIAQLVMIGVAVMIGLRADRWGRKPFLLVGFAVLPLRGLLYSQTTDPAAVMAGQVLDGIGAGVYGVIVILVVADVTRGTGVFNFASGVVITVQGAGASFGSLLGEMAAGAYGYGFAFGLLTGLAILALAILVFFMPETHPDKIPAVRLRPAPSLPTA